MKCDVEGIEFARELPAWRRLAFPPGTLIEFGRDGNEDG
jgi:hypothetical protein